MVFGRYLPRKIPTVSRTKEWLKIRHRLELKNVGVIREHIPISRRTVVRKVLQKFPYFHQNKLLELFGSIDAVIQHNSRPYSLLLKDLYDPMNPDKDTITVRHNFNLKEHEEELLNHLRPLLGQFTNQSSS